MNIYNTSRGIYTTMSMTELHCIAKMLAGFNQDRTVLQIIDLARRVAAEGYDHIDVC